MKRVLYAVLIAFACLPCMAQAPLQIGTLPLFRAFDQNGKPLSGGKLFSYAAGTTTPLATFADASGTVPNTNPVILDSTGTARVYLAPTPYKLVLQNQFGVQQWTVDNVDTVSDPGSITGTAVVQAPAGSQTITQPINTDFTVNTSGTGKIKFSLGFPQTFSASAINGEFNEEFFSGSDVNHRIASAMAACGTSYRFICNIIIPPYAPVDQSTMPVPSANNVTIIDQRGINGQGIFQGSDIPFGGCTPFQTNCTNAALPGLTGNVIYNYRVTDNDPADSIERSTQSQVLGCSITANVATCTTSNPNSFIAGEQIIIAGMTALPYINNAQLNSFYTVLAGGLTSTQFSFNFPHTPNVVFTADTGMTGVLCTFCGRNGFNITAYADGGITHTNGSDGSLQAATIGVFRKSTSSRQSVALNLTAQASMNQPTNFGNDFVNGLQINMTNRDALDPFGNESGIFLTAGGGTVGRAFQTTGSGAGGGFDMIGLFQGYKTYGLYLNGLTGRTADIHIVPLLDDGSHEIEGQNAANTATVWHIDSNGQANFPLINISGQTTINGSVINGTGIQHTSGTLGCTTGASVGSTCTTGQLAWTVPFPNVNYELTCSLNGPTGVPVISSVTRNTTGFTVTIAALTAVAATANYECIAVHN